MTDLKRRGLAVVLAVVATTGLVDTTTQYESGRETRTLVRADGSLDIRNVRGRQYLSAYRDIVGVWTICDGLTRGVAKGQTETPEGCNRRLEAELVEKAEAMLACIPTLRGPDRGYQQWAIVSLAYNAGAPAICASTAARQFRARNWVLGCEAILLWDKAGRPLRQVRGLTLRRRKERQICLTGLTGYPETTLRARIEAVK